MLPRLLVVPAVLLAACGGSAGPAAAPVAPTAAIASAPPAAAASEPATAPAAAAATKIRSVEGITEYLLANGLTILLFPDPTQSTLTVNVTYLVGSRLEGYGETGMAHLLEHMMFKGTPRHRDVGKLLEARGADSNASTDLDRTNYFETLAASQDNLDWALDLEADRMVHASIAADDLKTEFSVVRNEFERDEDSPANILDERISETAFLWHAYGHPTIGSRADIERVPVPALRAFYEKFYQPDDAVLVVAGKFDDAAALASIGRTFGALPKPTRALPVSYTVEPAQDGERRVTLARTGDVHVVELAFHGVSGASPDYAAFDAAADILTRRPSGRLYKKLVETKLAASISGETAARHDPSLVTFEAEVRDGKNVDRVEAILTAELDGFGASKIDDAELERWRTSTLKELELALTNSQDTALELSEYIALGDWRAMFAYRDRVRTVTAADVQRVARAYFRASNRTIGRFVPTKDPQRAPLTEGASVAAYVQGVKDGAGMDQGEAFAATLDNIDARTQRGTLGGGITTAFLPKKTRGGKVQLALHLHWGDAKSLQGKSTAGDLLGSLLARGTKTKTYQQLHDLEDQLKAHIWISTDAAGLTLHVDTLRDKLAPALDLASELLTAPAFPAKELELIKQEELAQLEQQLQDPEAVAGSVFEQISEPWPKTDPRYHPSMQEQIAAIEKVSVADIAAFYRAFAGAGHGELVVIGDFDPKAVGAQVEKLTSTWKSKAPYERLANKPFGVPAVHKSIDLRDKENTVLVLGHDLALRDSDPDYPALLLMNQVLGGGGSSRVWMRIREHEGLSYGVQTTVSAGALDEAGSFGGYAIVAPQNLAKALASFLDEIGKMTTGTIAPAELALAKDAWQKELDTALGDDGYVAAMLANQLFRGRTMDFSRKLRAAVTAVTEADVARVAKARLQPDRLVIVDAGDHAKAAAK